MKDLGITQLPLIPQLFVKFDDDKLTMIAAKVVDDIKIAGVPAVVDNFVKRFNCQFKLGTITKGPGELKFYGLDVTQRNDLSITVTCDEKVNTLEPYPISKTRRKQTSDKLNDVEKHEFMSINSSLGWLGIAASPFCALYASYMQQRLPNATVEELLSQSRHLRNLQKLGTSIHYARPPRGSTVSLSVVVFSDASRTDDRGQLAYLAGVLIGPLQKGSIFHTLSWQSHRSRRPAKSTPVAEILACSEAIDEGKTIKYTLRQIIELDLPLYIVVDTKDLFTTLSTRQNSIDKAIRPDVNSIRFEFETQNVDEIIWVPGAVNLADPGTKPNSALSDSLKTTLLTGKLQLDFCKAEHKSYGRSLG